MLEKRKLGDTIVSNSLRDAQAHWRHDDFKFRTSVRLHGLTHESSRRVQNSLQHERAPSICSLFRDCPEIDASTKHHPLCGEAGAHSLRSISTPQRPKWDRTWPLCLAAVAVRGANAKACARAVHSHGHAHDTPRRGTRGVAARAQELVRAIHATSASALPNCFDFCNRSGGFFRGQTQQAMFCSKRAPARVAFDVCAKPISRRSRVRSERV